MAWSLPGKKLSKVALLFAMSSGSVEMLLPCGPNCGVLCCEKLWAPGKNWSTRELGCKKCCGWAVGRYWPPSKPTVVTAKLLEGPLAAERVGSKPRPDTLLWNGAWGDGEGVCLI